MAILYDTPGDVGSSSDVHTFLVISAGGLSSPSVQTIVLSDGCRNSEMKMACWPVGAYCWDNFTFEYRPGAQHANADGMSRQCGQCQRPDCPVSASDSQVANLDTTLALVEQPFASSEMGESMDLLPELSGETCVATTLLDGLMADLLPAGADLDLIVASRQDTTLATVREWVQ